jgi:UrcA family protein
MTGNSAGYVAAIAAAYVIGAAGSSLAAGAAWSDAAADRTIVERPADGAHGAVRVLYDDLDLSREEGMEALYARLDTAARRACGHYDIRNMRERRSWMRCYDTSLADAVDQIGLERLAELAQSPRERRRAIGPRIAAQTRASTR